MIDFFLMPGNLPFVTALAVMIFMTVLEIISATVGVGLSEMVDSVLPEFDADIDVSADFDGADAGSAAGSIVKLLTWFRVGEVPVIILFIVFLTGFGLIGLVLQFILFQLSGWLLSPILATIPAFLAALPMVRFCGGVLGKYMPKDETYVVSEKSFSGQVATVTMGTAAKGKPAQAKLRDKYGQTHYILVVPDNDDESFSAGEKCIIVSQNGSVFHAIANTSDVLTT